MIFTGIVGTGRRGKEEKEEHAREEDLQREVCSLRLREREPKKEEGVERNTRGQVVDWKVVEAVRVWSCRDECDGGSPSNLLLGQRISTWKK